jgi:hypothetical protein
MFNHLLFCFQRAINLRKGLTPDAPMPFRHCSKPERKKALKIRIRKNYLRTLKEVREECNVEETSSEEEDGSSKFSPLFALHDEVTIFSCRSYMKKDALTNK